MRQPNGSFLVPLNRGAFAVVDEADAAVVGAYNWTLVRRGDRRYAQHRGVGYMHRFLWNHWGGSLAQDIDHANRDGLDNRRSNLRGATRSQNMANCPATRTSSSGLRGAYRYGERWRSQIRVDGRVQHLGVFDTKEEAAAAYREAAGRVYGEFAGRAE